MCFCVIVLIRGLLFLTKGKMLLNSFAITNPMLLHYFTGDNTMFKTISLFTICALLVGCAQLQTKSFNQSGERFPANEGNGFSSESQNYCSSHAQTHHNRPRNTYLFKECLSIYEMGAQYRISIGNSSNQPDLAVTFCHTTFPVEESAYENATEDTRSLIDQILRSRRYCLSGAL